MRHLERRRNQTCSLAMLDILRRATECKLKSICRALSHHCMCDFHLAAAVFFNCSENDIVYRSLELTHCWRNTCAIAYVTAAIFRNQTGVASRRNNSQIADSSFCFHCKISSKHTVIIPFVRSSAILSFRASKPCSSAVNDTFYNEAFIFQLQAPHRGAVDARRV